MIPESVLAQIREAADIVEIISAYVPLRRAGNSFKGNCPFHNEKTPSFIVNPDKQIFHCFGCHAGGNVFTFLMKVKQIDFREAASELSSLTGITIPEDDSRVDATAEKSQELEKVNALAADFYHQNLLKDADAQKAREYIRKRGIDRGTVEAFKLGYAPEAWDKFYQFSKSKSTDVILEKAGLLIKSQKTGGYYDRFRGRVIFPILDDRGRCVGMGGRVLDDSLPKYLNSPETQLYQKGKTLYGLYQAKAAIRQHDYIVVVEGYMDLIACHRAGVVNAVATLGTALTYDQIRLIKKHTQNVYMLYDRDKAGEAATLRSLELLLEKGMQARVVEMPQGHDPDSYVSEQGPESFVKCVKNAKNAFDYRFEGLAQQWSLEDLEGRVRIAKIMTAMIAKSESAIVKDAWMGELSKRLGLDAKAIEKDAQKSMSAISRVQVVTPYAGAKIDAKARDSQAPSMAEKMILGIALENHDLARQIGERLKDEDFAPGQSRRLMRIVLAADPAPMNYGAWLDKFCDDELMAGFVSMLSSEAETVVDKRKTFEDCCQWMQKKRFEDQRARLQQRLEIAQGQSNRQEVKSLLEQLNELNKGK